MSDGDTYEVCGKCGTEFLRRTMRQMTQSGVYYCLRCSDDELTGSGAFYSDDEGDDDE